MLRPSSKYEFSRRPLAFMRLHRSTIRPRPNSRSFRVSIALTFSPIYLLRNTVKVLNLSYSDCENFSILTRSSGFSSAQVVEKFPYRYSKRMVFQMLDVLQMLLQADRLKDITPTISRLARVTDLFFGYLLVTSRFQ